MICCRLMGIMVLSLTVMAETKAWPEGMSFVGLEHGHWQLFVVLPGSVRPQRIDTVSEPRTPAYHAPTARVAYIDASGNLREKRLSSSDDRVLLAADRKQSFTQPAFSRDGKRLFAVRFAQGISADADIVMVEDGGRVRALVTQPGAQLEPFSSERHLFYSNTLCVVGCGRILQELWRLDLISGEAVQLTLMNSIAREPAATADGDFVYFVSDRDGHYHIWRIQNVAGGGEPERLTNGTVTDTSPALSRSGDLYFIRRSPRGTSLMQHLTDGTEIELVPPPGITDLRDLEISP